MHGCPFTDRDHARLPGLWTAIMHGCPAYGPRSCTVARLRDRDHARLPGLWTAIMHGCPRADGDHAWLPLSRRATVHDHRRVGTIPTDEQVRAATTSSMTTGLPLPPDA